MEIDLTKYKNGFEFKQVKDWPTILENIRDSVLQKKFLSWWQLLKIAKASKH